LLSAELKAKFGTSTDGGIPGGWQSTAASPWHQRAEPKAPRNQRAGMTGCLRTVVTQPAQTSHFRHIWETEGRARKEEERGGAQKLCRSLGNFRFPVIYVNHTELACSRSFWCLYPIRSNVFNKDVNLKQGWANFSLWDKSGLPLIFCGWQTKIFFFFLGFQFSLCLQGNHGSSPFCSGHLGDRVLLFAQGDLDCSLPILCFLL
jgi:hypothetical protein